MEVADCLEEKVLAKLPHLDGSFHSNVLLPPCQSSLEAIYTASHPLLAHPNPVVPSAGGGRLEGVSARPPRCGPRLGRLPAVGGEAEPERDAGH